MSSANDLRNFDPALHDKVLWDLSGHITPQVPPKTFYAKAPDWIDKQIRSIDPSKGGTRSAIDSVADAIAFRLAWANHSATVFVCLPDDYHPIISIGLNAALTDCGLAVMFWHGSILIQSDLVHGSTKSLIDKYAKLPKSEHAKAIASLPIGGRLVISTDGHRVEKLRGAVFKVGKRLGYVYRTFHKTSGLEIRRAA